MLMTGIYIRKKSDEGCALEDGQRRLMETAATANGIFEETRVTDWPIHLSDAFQAEAWMLQTSTLILAMC